MLIIAALHFVPDTDSPYQAVAEYLSALPSGSYLAITHATWDTLNDEEREEAIQIAKIYSSSDNQLTMRTRAEVTRFFDGMEMLEPGVVAVNDWRPDSFDESHVGIYGAVARKP